MVSHFKIGKFVRKHNPDFSDFCKDCRYDFPPVENAEENGLLAVGGDLSVETLLCAYSLGIFPWYERIPILWYYPVERFLLFPEKLHIPRRLKQEMKKDKYIIQWDKNFDRVMELCGEDREGGTWITREMKKGYSRLHSAGYAHSMEVYRSDTPDEPIGGVYGVSLGKMFVAESMFYRESNASKIALATLVEQLREWGFLFLDAQIYSKHVAVFGAENVSSEVYSKLLKEALSHPSCACAWHEK